jgi:predicted nuclease of predicted toxin-antitoxin system
LKLLLDEHFAYAIAEELHHRGVDAVAITKDRPDLTGQDDAVVLRGANVDARVVVTNNVRDFAPLVDSFGLTGEQHYGVLFTDDDTFPRGEAGVGLLVRSLEAFANAKPDDWLLDSCMYLEPV